MKVLKKIVTIPNTVQPLTHHQQLEFPPVDPEPVLELEDLSAAAVRHRGQVVAGAVAGHSASARVVAAVTAAAASGARVAHAGHEAAGHACWDEEDNF